MSIDKEEDERIVGTIEECEEGAKALRELLRHPDDLPDAIKSALGDLETFVIDLEEFAVMLKQLREEDAP